MESGIHGKYYERNISTLIALKCLFNKNIKDFRMLSNPSDVNIFDDLILEVEYQDGERQLIMMQIKHVKNIRPMVVEKLDSHNKDFGLETYEKAFKEIINNTDFFRSNDIPEDIGRVYILYSNCKVTTTIENENIRFQPAKPLDFIDSSLEENRVFKLARKSGKYKKEFLDNFYFYTNQLNENEDVEAEIKNSLGGDIRIANEMISHFFKWAEPKSDTAKTLHKSDIKTLLLDIFASDFQPPAAIRDPRQNELLDIIREFNVTIISKDHSLEHLWSEILRESKPFFQDEVIELSSWNQPVSRNIEESMLKSCFKYSEDFLLNQKGLNKPLTTKTLSLLLVSLSKIPFFIRDDNHFFDIFKSLLPSLDIISVILHVKKDDLCFDNLTVCNTLNDVNNNVLQNTSKKIMISHQGKSKINIYPEIRKFPEIRKAIPIDNFIELLHDTVHIGKANNLPEYYINRDINVPVLWKDVINKLESIGKILIFNLPINKTLNGYKSMDLTTFLEKSKKDLSEYNILRSPGNPDQKIINQFGTNEKLYVLKYIPQNDVFSLVYTNYSTNILRPYLTTITKKDANLIGLLGDFGINVICSNAGIGNSTMLDFLNQHFPAEEWVVRLQLSKCDSSIKEIANLDQLFSYVFEHERKITSPKSDRFFRALYDHFKYKMIWLIDDYETIKEPHVLKLFKEAAEKGVRIWIVGRSSLKVEFEDLFNVFSMSLTEFSQEEQNIFFQKYLQQTDRKKGEIEDMLKAIQNTRNLFEDSFIGIPQNTIWLIKQVLKCTKNKVQVPCQTDWYQNFLNWNVMGLSEIDRSLYMRTLSKLALSLFFTASDLVELFKFDLEEFRQDVKAFRNKYPKDFFVTGFKDDNRPCFCHIKYAEFLSAYWLVHAIKKKLNQESPSDVEHILKMLYVKRLRPIRLFVDELLTKKLSYSKISIQGDFISFSFIGMDILGRTACHLMSSYGNHYELETATEIADLENLHDYVQIINISEDELQTSSISSKKLSRVRDIKNIQDFFRKDVYRRLPADYALLSGSLMELEEILKHHANHSIPFDFQKRVSQKCRWLLLFHSIKNGFNSILAKLDITNISNIKVSPSNMSFLHLAINSNNKYAVEQLTATTRITDWGTDIEGNTPLHLACKLRADDILRILLKSNGINTQFLNLANNYGDCHLCLLPHHDANWVKELIEKYPHFHCLSEDSMGLFRGNGCEIIPLTMNSSWEKNRD